MVDFRRPGHKYNVATKQQTVFSSTGNGVIPLSIQNLAYLLEHDLYDLTVDCTKPAENNSWTVWPNLAMSSPVDFLPGGLAMECWLLLALGWLLGPVKRTQKANHGRLHQLVHSLPRDMWNFNFFLEVGFYKKEAAKQVHDLWVPGVTWV